MQQSTSLLNNEPFKLISDAISKNSFAHIEAVANTNYANNP